MIKVAKNDKVVLKVMYDDTADNPREWDNLGTMVCFHNRYLLGDAHHYSDPRDFLEELAYQFVDSDIAIEILSSKADKEFEGFEIVQDDDGYIIEADDYNPFVGCVYDTMTEAIEDLEREMQDWIDNYGLQELSNDELLEIIESNAVILPLYLYDHSGITMNTTGFSCPWDSGQVGWIYVSHDDIVKEFGSLDIEKAEKLLKAEVDVYDQYLTGDVYGFVLETVDGEVIDSCWGFYGLKYLEQELKSGIPQEYAKLVDELKWVS